KPVTPAYIPDYQLPEQITICGETIPLENRDVYERMDYEFLLAAHSRLQVFLWLRRAARYFPYIEKKLAEEGLPQDLKYLAVAESDLRPTVRSPANAVGVWQFMQFTAKKYGLRKDEDFDERQHFERSTDAALKYLRRLHDMFGTWTLAMAAYNCGEGCVGKAVKEQEVRDYFRLYLPAETMRYVFRIAAVKILVENPDKYGYRMDPGLVYPPLTVDEVTVDLAQEVHLTRAAKAIGTDFKVLKELNPWILGSHLPQGRYNLWTPVGLGDQLVAFLKSTAPAATDKTGSGGGSSVVASYTVHRGDTLFKISRQTGVPVETLRELNNIHGDELLVGQQIRLK
ncbi:MAG: transglycosylase SLT domain-containing protein, partial [Thermodesulfobacteriota bacterium]